MVRHEGGRWDVGTKNNAVYLARVSDSGERLFDDLVSPEDARELAELLTKYADRSGESKDADKSDESEESDESSKDSDDSKDSDKSD